MDSVVTGASRGEGMSKLYECSECVQTLTEGDLENLPPNLTAGWGHICKDRPRKLCESYLKVVSEVK